jgi:hypothetical protein
MFVPSNHFDFQKLRRFNGPATFVGAGFLLGLLVFLVWLASQPDRGSRSSGTGDDGVDVTGALVAPGDGVLGGITGESASRSGVAETSDNDFGLPGEGEFVDEAQLQADADATASGEDVSASQELSEGAALTDGLLGPATPVGGEAAPAPTPRLQSYFVEVETASGQVQLLKLDAESSQHALAILRDFRGDPRVLRGPTTEPLP